MRKDVDDVQPNYTSEWRTSDVGVNEYGEIVQVSKNTDTPDRPEPKPARQHKLRRRES